MNSTIKDLLTRRSIRKYTDQPVGDAELKQILEAGTYAPTGRNIQAPIIVAIRNPEEVKNLSRLNAQVMGSDADPFYGAPAVLVVLSAADSRHICYDGALVMGNLMNAAHALGLGSCWIHRAKEVFESEEGKALLKKWGIEGDYVGVGNCILGYPAEQPEAKPRKENYVYYVD